MIQRNKACGHKGFSLVEIIIAIAIMAVVTAIVVPSYIGYVAKAKEGVLENNADGLAEMIQIYAIDFSKDDWYGDWDQNGTDTLNNFIEYELEVINEGVADGVYENNVSMKNPYSGEMSVLDANNTIGADDSLGYDGYCPAVFLTKNSSYAYDGTGSTSNIIGTVVAYFDVSDDTTDHIEVYYINKDGSKSDYLEIIE